ncbi:MAG TPA: SAM-dependent methyltransferase [Burkholderiales bacterium]|nr:SAM-dependent methyltransferase [Burkholderiales bacterium]
MNTGTLYVVPCTLGDSDPSHVLPPATLNIVRGLERFVAEEPKSARAFLKRAGIRRPLREILIEAFNQQTDRRGLPALLQPLLDGFDLGLLSEAGYPAVADPGAELIALAQERGLRVIPLVGPSSVLLALAASGLNGQSFCFHGYLPVKAGARAVRIRELEARSRSEHAAQIFIETPYRNNQLLAALLEVLQPDTRLCIASELTLTNEMARTMSVERWRAQMTDLDRKPTVFALQAAERLPASGVSAPGKRWRAEAASRRQRLPAGG